jgi:hypothetical protein
MLAGRHFAGEEYRNGFLGESVRRRPWCRVARWTSWAAAKRMNRLAANAANWAGSANSAAISRPISVPNTSGNAVPSPGKVRPSWPSN